MRRQGTNALGPGTTDAPGLRHVPATDVLRREHGLILRALDVLEAAARRLQTAAGPGEHWWAELMDWLRVFADRNHHAKEERGLFPAMARAGVPDGHAGPVGVMLEEHAEGRALVAAMASGGAATRAASARRYVDLLRAHIEKENGVLFPLAEAVLTDDAQRALGREFDTIADALGRDASPSYAEAVLEGLRAALDSDGAPVR